MDLFEAYPHLRRVRHPILHGRSLRLLSLSAIAYDADAYYFELSEERYWTHTPETGITIGVRGASLRADNPRSPLRALRYYIRHSWGSRVKAFPSGPLYVLEDADVMQFPSNDVAQPTIPHLLMLTPPRLGGGEMPDALAQAVYVMELRRPPSPVDVPGILRVEKAALGEFLAQPRWTLETLCASPWATLLQKGALPEGAALQPVLALRGLAHLWQAGYFPLPSMESTA